MNGVMVVGVTAKGHKAGSPSGPSEQRESGINRSEPATERVVVGKGRGGRVGQLPLRPAPSQA